LRLSRIAVTDYGFFNTLPMAFSKPRIGSKTTAGNQLFTIDQNVSLPRILDLVVAAVLSRREMLHHTISDHIHIDVDQTSDKMVSGHYRSSVIPVFPKRALSLFSAVNFLSRFSCNQLQAFRDYLLFIVCNSILKTAFFQSNWGF
jgi:hypothetical protein